MSASVNQAAHVAVVSAQYIQTTNPDNVSGAGPSEDSLASVFTRPAPFSHEQIKTARPLQIVLSMPTAEKIIDGDNAWFLFDSSSGVCCLTEVLIDTATKRLTLISNNRVIEDSAGSYTNYRAYLEFDTTVLGRDASTRQLLDDFRDLKTPNKPVFLEFDVVGTEPYFHSKTDSRLKIANLRIIDAHHFSDLAARFEACRAQSRERY